MTLGVMLGALAILSAPATAQEHEDFDSYVVNSQVVGQGGWEEWGPGAGATVSSSQSLSSGNSIDIKGASDLIHRYSGYNSGKWEYTAWQYIPKTFTGKTYFIILSSFGTTNKWAVQVAFNKASGNVEPDAGKSASKATTPIIYDKWVQIRVLIHLDADWVQFYYDGKLLDDATVANHPTLGGGWKWTGGPFGGSKGPKNIGALDLFANKATSVFYDEIMLQPLTGWADDFDSYAAKSQVVLQGGWEEWGPGAGAIVASTPSRGPGNSIDIKAASDLVHRYKGYTKGTWEYSAWQYIPKAFTGKTYFIILSSFGTTNKWAVQVAFNKTTGNVEPDAGKSNSKATTPIIYDKWVHIQVMIHLDADWVQFYYNGKLLDDATVTDHSVFGGGWKWTGGPFGGSKGPKAIGAVDLFANKATSVFYDDMGLRPVPVGARNYGAPTAGSSGKPHIYATGDAVLTNTKFGLAGRSAAKKAGLLALTAKAIPAGLSVVGFNLLVDPNPIFIPIVVTSDAAGGATVPLPLPSTLKGKRIYGQFVWIDKITPIVLSASGGMELLIQ
jgi:hypothetical protein